MKYVKELEGLRGIMALWVVIGHWSTTADIPTAIGQTKLYNGYAVDVFIILSGFAITAMLLKRSDPYPDYLGKRFFRIFPIYLFYLGLSILLAGVALDTWQMAAGEGYMNARRVDIAQNSIDNALPHSLAHLVALHGVVPADWLPDTDFAFLGQAWSISLEWQFYLVAPLLIGALMLPLRGLSGLAGGGGGRLLLSAALCGALLALAGGAGGYIAPRGFLGLHLEKFALGILSALALDRAMGAGWRLSRGVVAALFALGLVLTLSVLERKWLLPYGVWYWSMWTICAWHMGGNALAGFGSRILTARPTLWLGRMSYSVYLSHMLLIVLLVRLLHMLGLSQGWLGAALLLGLLVPVTLLVSWLSYLWIEKPFNDFGRQLRYSPRQRSTGV